MWVLEYGEEIVLLDCGVMFPEADMLGVDLVLPDISYLRDKTERIKAVLLTHGHEDHIGAVPHLIADLGFPPIYGTPLTLGMVTGKLKEHRLLDKTTLVPFKAGATITISSSTVSPEMPPSRSPPAYGSRVRDVPWKCGQLNRACSFTRAS